MSREPARPPRVASRRLTSATLTGGVLFSAACFLVAGGSEVLWAEAGEQPSGIAALAAGLVALEPSAWATLGVYALVVTPALGVAVSAIEYVQVGDRGTVALALLVLALLALSAVVAVLR